MMSFIAYALFAVSFSTGIMYLIVRSDKKNEPSYIFWTVTLGIFVAALAAMGLDFLTFRVAFMGKQELIKSYLFKASFRNDSAAIVALSFAVTAVLIFIVWRYGAIFKRIIAGFNISAEMLDDLTYKSIAIGFPIFTLGGLIFGAIWAQTAWGTYWSWDPKETWALITWLVYTAFLHRRTWMFPALQSIRSWG